MRLAATLESIWEAAHGAAADEEQGRASFTALADTVRAIAEDAAEALADLPLSYSTADEA
jgi:hypothetical protein